MTSFLPSADSYSKPGLPEQQALEPKKGPPILEAPLTVVADPHVRGMIQRAKPHDRLLANRFLFMTQKPFARGWGALETIRRGTPPPLVQMYG